MQFYPHGLIVVKIFIENIKQFVHLKKRRRSGCLYNDIFRVRVSSWVLFKCQRPTEYQILLLLCASLFFCTTKKSSFFVLKKKTKQNMNTNTWISVYKMYISCNGFLVNWCLIGGFCMLLLYVIMYVVPKTLICWTLNFNRMKIRNKKSGMDNSRNRVYMRFACLLINYITCKRSIRCFPRFMLFFYSPPFLFLHFVNTLIQ